jgi:hypothetical protein
MEKELAMKMVLRYEVREFVGAEYSQRLGAKLRPRARAARLVRALRRAGREVFLAPMRVLA